MINVLETWRPGATKQLRLASIATLSKWEEVELRYVPDASTDVRCSVAGAYVADETPPRLAVAESASAGRRAFTALHELGHHLQQTRTELMDVLLAQPDKGHALEDAACDSFAGAILLPAAAVTRHIGDRGPTAHNVVSLWRDSAASRAAACVAAAEHLPAPGHVLLLDAAGVVTFGAAHGLPPVSRRSDQSSVPVVSASLSTGGRSCHGMTRFRYRGDIVGGELWAQTADMGGFVVVVAVTDHAPWEDFAPPSRDSGPSAKWWTCESCQHLFPAFGKRCDRCAAPDCPECGRCNCAPVVAERTCQKCNIVYPLRMYRGDSARCISCD